MIQRFLARLGWRLARRFDVPPQLGVGMGPIPLDSIVKWERDAKVKLHNARQAWTMRRFFGREE